MKTQEELVRPQAPPAPPVIQEAPPLPPITLPPAPSKARRWRIPLIAGLALVVALVLVFTFVLRANGPATPAQLRLITSTPVSATLSWATPAGEIDNVAIYRNGSRVGTVPASQTSFVDEGLVPGTTYTYTVTSVRGEAESEKSGSLAVTTAMPAAPVAVRSISRTPTTITIAWTSPTSGADEFIIYRNDTAVGTIDGTSTSFVDDGLSPTTQYTYSIATVVSGVESPVSSSVTASTAAASLESAGISGTWSGTLRVTSESGYTSIAKGNTFAFNWRIQGNTLYGEVRGFSWATTLRRSGTQYRGSGKESGLSNCLGVPVATTVTVAFRVTNAATVGGAWQATRLVGTLSWVAPRTIVGTMVCPGASFAGSFVAT